jgi:hypothetical protein
MFLKSTESGPAHWTPHRQAHNNFSSIPADKSRLKIDDFSARNLNQGRSIQSFSLSRSSVFSHDLGRNLPKKTDGKMIKMAIVSSNSESSLGHTKNSLLMGRRLDAPGSNKNQK